MNMMRQENSMMDRQPDCSEGRLPIPLLNLFLLEMGCPEPAMSWTKASNLANDYDLDQSHIAKRMALSMQEAFEPGLNPVGFVKERALTEHGIKGIEVKPNDPDDQFFVTDLAEAESCFADLLWEMAEQSNFPDGKYTVVAHILANCGNELDASTQERLRAHFIF